jgi:hypothetical protein
MPDRRNALTMSVEKYIDFVEDKISRGFQPVTLYEMYDKPNDELSNEEIIGIINQLNSGTLSKKARDAIITDINNLYTIADADLQAQIKTACELNSISLQINEA